MHSRGEAESGGPQQSLSRRGARATWDLPQLCYVPGMSFTGMQGQCCPGHTEVPGHVMPRANPVLAGNPREAAPEQRLSCSHSFAHGCTDPDRHRCPSPSSPNLPDALAMMLKHHVLAKVDWFWARGQEAAGGSCCGALVCLPTGPCHLALCSSSPGGCPGLWQRLLALVSPQGPESMAAALAIKHLHRISHLSVPSPESTLQSDYMQGQFPLGHWRV